MVAVYLDSGALGDMHKYWGQVQGFTTNPSLMRKDGVEDYRSFAKAAVAAAAGKPISLEVLADDEGEMEMQAHQLAAFGSNVYVKIPVITSEGVTTQGLCKRLIAAGINLNITACLTIEQAQRAETLFFERPGIVSVFAGRIMDTQRLPLGIIDRNSKARFLWASAREVFNLRQAEEWGYDIITLPPSLIDKLSLRGKDLTAYSLETVKQFHQDGKTITW